MNSDRYYIHEKFMAAERIVESRPDSLGLASAMLEMHLSLVLGGGSGESILPEELRAGWQDISGAFTALDVSGIGDSQRHGRWKENMDAMPEDERRQFHAKVLAFVRDVVAWCEKQG